MVFYLNEQLLRDGSAEAGFFAFFQNIMLAYKEGKHLIVLHIKEARKLLKNPNIDINSKNYLQHYLYHSKGNESVFRHFNVIIQVVSRIDEEKKIFDAKQRVEFRLISFNRFIDSASIQKTILLGENGNDSNAYALFAKYYLHTEAIKNYSLSYSRRAGGGSTTHEEYKEIYEKDEECCLCILDSDKRTKMKGYGHTALKVARYHNTQHPKNFKNEYVILPVLEVENLFPDSFYKETFLTKFKYPSEIFPSIRRMETHEKNIRKYFDFKKGIRGYYAQSDHNVIQFWREIICKSNIKSIVLDENTHCYVQGFGENILTQFLSCESIKIFQYVDLEPDLKKVWLRLGKYICSYIIGSRVTRAI